MNKQLTKKTIGIAASAALIASLAVSGSAFAAPGNGNGGANGKKGSIEILSICDLNKTSGKLTVWTKIVDTSSESAYGADLDSYTDHVDQMVSDQKKEDQGQQREPGIIFYKKTGLGAVQRAGQDPG